MFLSEVGTCCTASEAHSVHAAAGYLASAGEKKKKSEHVPGEKSHDVARHIPVLIVGGRGRVVAAQPVTAPQVARR